jgi:2-dehydro-3-deoxyphosphogluconate aldolase/(4S)-4-hydroxy-2-oxoglutarate aldolase
MTKDEARRRIEEIGIIPAVRLSSAEDALFAAEAVSSGGISIVEVTMTVPGAVDVVYKLAREHPDILVGAGTLFDVKTAKQCLDAGAGFLTSPGLDLEVSEFANDSDAVYFPGALTPTEIMAARKAGCDFVKVFPCSQLGGASYIKTLRAPFPDLPLIASGGVNQQTAAEFVLAGASVLGIGRDLIQPEAIHRRQRGWIVELARRFSTILSQARAERKERST